jgi:hypothetical protein
VYPALAWQFTKDNFAGLSDRFDPTDKEHAAALAQFAPAHATAGGRITADRPRIRSSPTPTRSRPSCPRSRR